MTLREAIAARLLATTALTQLLATPTGSVFHRRAPQQSKPPMVVFAKQAGVADYNFGGELAQNSESWLVRGVSFGRTTDRAEQIGAAIDAALTDAPLTITGGVVMAIFRESDVDYPEQVGKELFQHNGAVYRIAVSR